MSSDHTSEHALHAAGENGSASVLVLRKPAEQKFTYVVRSLELQPMSAVQLLIAPRSCDMSFAPSHLARRHPLIARAINPHGADGDLAVATLTQPPPRNIVSGVGLLPNRPERPVLSRRQPRPQPLLVPVRAEPGVEPTPLIAKVRPSAKAIQAVKHEPVIVHNVAPKDVPQDLDGGTDGEGAVTKKAMAV